MRRRWLYLVLALAALTLPPGPARAGGISPLYNRVLHAYRAYGRIPPCEFTSPSLATALSEVDSYGQQYFADFIAAIQTALTARASGACSGLHKRAVGVTGRTNGGASLPGAPALPSSVTSPTGSGLPLPLILLLVLSGLVGGSLALIPWWRSRGREGWAAGWRHGAAEARYQAAGAWLRWRDGRRR